MSRQLTLPSNRLCAAASIAAASLYDAETKNLRAIDVGCDHAKLSIYLVQSGICSHVTACDINQGPVERAKENVSRRTFKGQPLSNYIDIVCTDGLFGLEESNPNRIFILGMGGELIADILDKAAFIRRDDKIRKIGFVLQPMTSEEDLRIYLYTNGFNIINEELVLDKGRIYAIIYAVYDGTVRNGTMAEMLLGKCNIEKGTKLFEKQLSRRIRITEKALTERKTSGLDCTELEKLLCELNTIKENRLCTL